MNKNNDQQRNPDRAVPYWKRAHRDWRFRIAVVVMLIAISIYVLSDDLAWQPHLPLGSPQP